MRTFFSDDCCKRAGDQNKENRTVQHTLIKQADRITFKSITGNNVITDQHRCKSECRMCADKTKNQPALIKRKSENPLGNPC